MPAQVTCNNASIGKPQDPCSSGDIELSGAGEDAMSAVGAIRPAPGAVDKRGSGWTSQTHLATGREGPRRDEGARVSTDDAVCGKEAPAAGNSDCTQVDRVVDLVLEVVAGDGSKDAAAAGEGEEAAAVEAVAERDGGAAVGEAGCLGKMQESSWNLLSLLVGFLHGIAGPGDMRLPYSSRRFLGASSSIQNPNLQPRRPKPPCPPRGFGRLTGRVP
jgi:hypothetical protein